LTLNTEKNLLKDIVATATAALRTADSDT